MYLKERTMPNKKHKAMNLLEGIKNKLPDSWKHVKPHMEELSAKETWSQKITSWPQKNPTLQLPFQTSTNVIWMEDCATRYEYKISCLKHCYLATHTNVLPSLKLT